MLATDRTNEFEKGAATLPKPHLSLIDLEHAVSQQLLRRWKPEATIHVFCLVDDFIKLLDALGVGRTCEDETGAYE